MEIRKVQVTGGSSYIVSLPKDWVLSSNVKKNDPVGLIVQQDGTLLVTPRIEAGTAQRTKEFPVSATTDPAYLYRCLVGAYVAGYTAITLTAQGKMPSSIRMGVREFTRMTIGQEVVEETETSVTIKDLLNPVEMPFRQTITRMAVIVRGMHQDGIEALRSGNQKLAGDVVERDNDVDRLHRLIARQCHLVLGDPAFSRKMNVTPAAAMSYFLASRILERIGDHGTRIARSAVVLLGEEVDAEMVTMIGEASATSQAIFDHAVSSLFGEDLEGANDAIQQVVGLEKQARAVNKAALKYAPATATAIVSLSDSIRRIGEYSTDICENTINTLIDRG
ncbi:phosphate uptake regulator PhoU [uncultured Methanofollis sp.]|uniref:phosphate signaling complex PhoU family protein n=1 Tax=uncultured Methanofollis sp. TaxID=262500 RepID=UPI0026040F8D|nr:phosphate uptake regulator PhoU [uncultured Methanofollis sp.]